MDTLVVKISESTKTNALIEMLKSMDFVSSVDYIDDINEVRRLFEQVNAFAEGTDLQQLTMDDINAEIKAHRLEKKLNSN